MSPDKTKVKQYKQECFSTKNHMSLPFRCQKDQNVNKYNYLSKGNNSKNKQSRVNVLAYDIILLCFMTHRLNVVYNCMNFYSNSFNGFQVKVWTRNSIATDQRTITPKVNKAELWFSSMTHRLLYLCLHAKFG